VKAAATRWPDLAPAPDLDLRAFAYLGLHLAARKLAQGDADIGAAA
jgi:hypothetical protein